MTKEMAIVLINMKPEAEGIGDSLRAVPGVTEVHGLYGIYDVIVFVDRLPIYEFKFVNSHYIFFTKEEFVLSKDFELARKFAGGNEKILSSELLNKYLNSKK